jgi:hypothetical protein
MNWVAVVLEHVFPVVFILLSLFVLVFGLGILGLLCQLILTAFGVILDKLLRR